MPYSPSGNLPLSTVLGMSDTRITQRLRDREHRRQWLVTYLNSNYFQIYIILLNIPDQRQNLTILPFLYYFSEE